MKTLTPALLCALALALALSLAACRVSVDPGDPTPGYENAVVVKKKSVHLHRCPDVSCKKQGLVQQGETVRVYEYSQGWARVMSPKTGNDGWMPSGYLSY